MIFFKPCQFRSRSHEGFSFIEIVVAVGIVISLAGILFFSMGKTRESTKRAIHHLRALEIAQETIDWARATQLDAQGLKAMLNQTGSLLDPATNKPVPLPEATTGLYSITSGTQPLAYPKQYDSAFFYRTIAVNPVPNPDGRVFLYRVTVDVSWNEGRAPEHIDSVGGKPDRMRSLTMSTLLTDDREEY